MTAVLGESRPITYYWDEPVSPTAVGPTPVIPPEPPAEDDSADVGYSKWSRVEEHSSTSQIAERFSGAFPAALFGLEQINDEAKEESSPESPATALQNIFDILKRHYNTHPMSAYVSPHVSSTWNEGGNHHVWFEVHQIAERFSGAFPAALFGLEQINDEAKEESLPALLANALRDLHEINDEADEEEIEPPSESAMADADRLIRAIYDILPRQYLVELLPEGVIAITVPGGLSCPLGTVKRRSVMLLCESDGGALCSVNMNGAHRRKRYSNANQLPDRFLREALSELGRE